MIGAVGEEDVMSAGERITLYVELADILQGHPAGLSLSDLANQVNRRGATGSATAPT